MSKRWIAPIACVVGLGLCLAAAAQAPAPTPMSFQDYLNGLSPAERTATVMRAARNGLYMPTFDYCAALTELADLRWYIDKAPEPIGSAA